jgi:2'-5' RNA ligase
MIITHFTRYFLAVRPNPVTAAAIARVRDSVGPLQSCIATDKFHSTLGIVAEVPGPNPAIPAWAERALGDFLFETFFFSLGRLAVQPGIAQLLPGEKRVGIRKLQATLFERLRLYGVEIRNPKKYRPHMTLGYRPQRRENKTITPIGWMIDRIDLIESRVGKSIHRTVGSWRLLSPRQYDFDLQ